MKGPARDPIATAKARLTALEAAKARRDEIAAHREAIKKLTAKKTKK